MAGAQRNTLKQARGSQTTRGRCTLNQHAQECYVILHLVEARSKSKAANASADHIHGVLAAACERAQGMGSGKQALQTYVNAHFCPCC